MSSSLTKLCARLRRHWRGFAAARDGNVALLFALALVPITMLGFGLVDFQRASTVKAQLQDSLDAATLAAARSQATTTTDLTSVGQGVLAANMSPFPGVTVTGSSFSLDAKGNVVGQATATVNTYVASLYLGKQLTVTASNQVVRANDKLEIALVLDNTGSMAADNKLPTLISSARTLVSTLFASNKTGDASALKISVVPFSQTVNVGSAYQGQSWLTGVLPAAYQTQLNSQYSNLSWTNGSDLFSTAGVDRLALFKQMNVAWGGCVESRPAPYDASDAAPSVSNPASLFVAYFAPDEPGNGSSSASSNGGYTNDYLADGLKNGTAWNLLQGNAAKYKGTPRSGTSPSSYAYGPNAGCQLAPLLRLSTDQTAIQNKIAQMVAVGDTNLNIGLMWGWHTLSPNAPFGDGVAYGTPNVRKIVVFLTDGWNEATPAGDNDQSYYSGLGYIWQNRAGVGVNSSASARQAALDARTTAACNAMKSAGITIYTVRIDVSSSQSPVVLQSCASTASDFFDVPQVSNLPAVFAQIANAIGQLRLSQ